MGTAVANVAATGYDTWVCIWREKGRNLRETLETKRTIFAILHAHVKR